jgi:hypothetical protein
MVDIEPFQRKITKFMIKEFKGGTKFQNNPDFDTCELILDIYPLKPL